MFKKIVLKKGKESFTLRKHPWIFSGAIQIKDHSLADGDRVIVVDANDNNLGIGHYSNGSIAVRMLDFERNQFDENIWESKIRKAFELREKWNIVNPENNAYRLIHGEGDGLPGLIIDIYNDAAVIQAHSMGMFHELENIKNALINLFPSTLKTVYSKSKASLHKENMQDHYLMGNKSETEIIENGITFSVNWEEGQKTGFFLDQRENRQFLKEISEGKSVLNTFCYTGGFSVYALKGGAKKVISVDVSSNAIKQTAKNILINKVDQSKHESIVADVMKYLDEIDEQFDIVILDPPAFAKNISKRHQAVQGYKRLNMKGLKRVKKGGMLITFSCSQVIDDVLFKNTVTAAAIEAGVNAKIIYKFNQGPDHPENIFHPEGHYLKGLGIFVE